MATTARGCTKDNIYHIVSKGARGMEIFRDKHDKDLYISLMAFYANQHNIHIFAHALMPNHIHFLLISFNDKSLSNFMHDLQMVYAKYFNSRYDGQGHVWNSRYKSFIVTDDQYFYQVKEYIEENAVKARLVNTRAAWRWSSAYKKIEDIKLLRIKKSVDDEQPNEFAQSLMKKRESLIKKRE